MFKFGRRREKEFYFVADIGSEALKTVVLRKEGAKTSVVSSSLDYFHEQDAFEAGLSKLEEYVKMFDRKPHRCIFTLRPAQLLARVVNRQVERPTPGKTIDQKEASAIFEKVQGGAKKMAAENFFQNSGVLPSDIQFTNSRILQQKLDGYPVPKFEGYSGKNLSFKVLTVFGLKSFLQRTENTCRNAGLSSVKVVHEAEGFLPFVSGKPDAVFIDIGGEETGVFLARRGRIEATDRFALGSQSFSQAISETLGVGFQDARALKERYADRALSEGVSQRMAELLHRPLRGWFESLQLKLKEMATSNLLPSKIYIFGGGAFLPDFKKILQEGKWQNIVFVGKPDVKTLFPKDTLGASLQDGADILNNPQYTPALLTYYAEKSN
ncbi:MAG: Actin-like ATPase involved in cell division-like protein [Parcubacteria group bacterium Gr01-1014_30]|nr:MAG: Actin-like ATPase involved in cell division-like protein [Parcubacteria group bacterium Gr01-1014_30]